MSKVKDVKDPVNNNTGNDFNKEKVCFVVAPIGGDDSDDRRATQGLLDAVLRPLLEKEFNYKVVIAHEISALGSITDQVVNNIIDSELVIADLTGLNANVMYELAIRHCANLPVVVIANKNTKLPFDVVVERTIFYTNDMSGGVELKNQLDKAIRFIHSSGKTSDNPVSRAKNAESVRENVMRRAEGGDFEKFMLDKVDGLENSISAIAREIKNRGGGSDFLNQVVSGKGSDNKLKEIVGVLSRNLESINFSVAEIIKNRVYRIDYGPDLSDQDRTKMDVLIGFYNSQGVDITKRLMS